jgi:hypothetical protein
VLQQRGTDVGPLSAGCTDRDDHMAWAQGGRGRSRSWRTAALATPDWLAAFGLNGSPRRVLSRRWSGAGAGQPTPRPLPSHSDEDIDHHAPGARAGSIRCRLCSTTTIKRPAPAAGLFVRLPSARPVSPPRTGRTLRPALRPFLISAYLRRKLPDAGGALRGPNRPAPLS